MKWLTVLAACAVVLGGLRAVTTNAQDGAGPGREWWVDQAAAPGGDGSAARPFGTIGEGLKAAAGGDTVTIRAGIYPESIAVTQSGTADRPTVVRAAPGQRVVVSGFAPVTGWQPYRDGIYTTTVEWPARDLFVGCRPIPVSRWPGVNAPWRVVKDVDAAGGTFHDGQGLAGARALEPVAARAASAILYLYVRAGNYFSDAPLARLDPAAGTLASGDAKAIGRLRGDGDRYQVINHPDLIRAPGEWAYEALDDKRTRLYFRPDAPADLQRTQARRPGERLVFLGRYGQTTSHVRVEGLEIAGSAGMGIQVQGTDHAVVSRCLVHHCGGQGISVRRSTTPEVSGCVVVANGSGVGVASSQQVLIERNEVAFNLVDGINVAGNVTGRPGGEPTTSDVRVRRNYVHHHYFLSHPDNFQSYRGVEKMALEENVMLWSGQAVMTEESDHCAIRNCVLVGTAAVAVVFGHGNASDWSVEQSTIGLGGWGGVSMTGRDYRLQGNVLFQNALEIGESTASDYNLYAPADESQSIALVSKPRWQRFQQPAEVAAATGQEKHSLRADAGFRSAPARQAVVVWRDENALDRLFVRQAGARKPTEGFAVGDRIEVNGDGVLRRVLAVEDDALRFEPPLPQLPLREALVWNWKGATSCLLDLRPREGSPALKAGRDGTPVGSTLDIPAFQRGDFDGDGKRDLPEIPEDLKAAWPDPNAVVLPIHGQ